MIVVLKADRYFGDGCSHAGIIFNQPTTCGAVRRAIAVVKEQAAQHFFVLRFVRLLRNEEANDWAELHNAKVGMWVGDA